MFAAHALRDGRGYVDDLYRTIHLDAYTNSKAIVCTLQHYLDNSSKKHRISVSRTNDCSQVAKLARLWT